jgi:hypothetical protein
MPGAVKRGRPKPAGQSWRSRGFESKGAAQSVQKQYGLVQDGSGGFEKPDMAFLENQVGGWIGNPTNVTPVGIGGARWNVGQGQADFTGQASDVQFGKQPVGNAFNAGAQVPYGVGKLGQGPKPGGFGGPQKMHTEIGQQNQKAGGNRINPRPNNGVGGMPNAGVPGGFGTPNKPVYKGGPAGPPGSGPKFGGKPKFGGGPAKPKGPKKLPFKPAPGLMNFPSMPPQGAPFLPMTQGFESAQRGANDALSQIEGQFAEGQAMIPAQLALEQQRLATDQDVATQRLKEQLAERGVFTPYGASGDLSSAPAGGGIGESLYGRDVATPFGRAGQDLASSGAQAYQDLYRSYGLGQLGYNQSIMEALLQRAQDAQEQGSLGLGVGGYELPGLPGPMFSSGPGGGGQKPGGHKKAGKRKPKGRR